MEQVITVERNTSFYMVTQHYKVIEMEHSNFEKYSNFLIIDPILQFNLSLLLISLNFNY